MFESIYNATMANATLASHPVVQAIAASWNATVIPPNLIQPCGTACKMCGYLNASLCGSADPTDPTGLPFCPVLYVQCSNASDFQGVDLSECLSPGSAPPWHRRHAKCFALLDACLMGLCQHCGMCASAAFQLVRRLQRPVPYQRDGAAAAHELAAPGHG